MHVFIKANKHIGAVVLEKNKKNKNYNKLCIFCGSYMNCCGASDSVGGISWKCKNKKCGRRFWGRFYKISDPIL